LSCKNAVARYVLGVSRKQKINGNERNRVVGCLVELEKAFGSFELMMSELVKIFEFEGRSLSLLMQFGKSFSGLLTRF
jgi:hypothetical protein